MIQKFFYILFVIGAGYTYEVFSAAPPIHCDGLPGCGVSASDNKIEEVSVNLIATLIQYVAVFAVLALMFSGIMYMLSSGEEEKTKKAKSWIIWSMVGVILSIGALYIVNILNNISI